MLESRVRRHVSRIRRGTRNCAEISAAPFGAVVAERVMRRRFARVPTSLKPAVQRLQAPATVIASNSSYCATIFSEYLTVYMCVSSIQNLSCVMCVFSCVSVLVCVCWCLCHQITVLFVCVCFNACVCRDGIFQKNWKWKQTQTNKHTHDTTKINIAPARARMTRTNREECTIFDIFCCFYWLLAS